MRALFLLLSFFAMSLPIYAQTASRIGAVLVVEDGDEAITQKLGVAIYKPFLDAGPYATVKTVLGTERETERLAQALIDLARTHDQIDVVASIHTTYREADRLKELLPVDTRRKLRLVYSTACYGAEAEREAWVSVGAKVVVTHQGLNNPLFALPIFLSRWIRGDSVRQAVQAGAVETALAHRLALSLPGGESMDSDVVEGSVPVVSGNANLTIAHGWLEDRYVSAGVHRWYLRSQAPERLSYSRARGGALGLALRAMAGRLTIRGPEVKSLLERISVPYPFSELDPDAFSMAYAQRVRTVETSPLLSVAGFDVGGLLRAPLTFLPIGAPPLRRVKVQTRYRLKIVLKEAQDLPLGKGFSLRFAETVWLRARELDPQRRVINLDVGGISLRGYGISYTLGQLKLSPYWLGGYKVLVRGRLGRFLPLGGSFPIGGRNPDEVVASSGNTRAHHILEERREEANSRSAVRASEGMTAELGRLGR